MKRARSFAYAYTTHLGTTQRRRRMHRGIDRCNARAFVAAPTSVPSVLQKLPELEGDSLTDRHVVLPRDAIQKPFLLLVCYERGCAENQKAWLQALDQHVRDVVPVYAVVDAARVPSFVRGLIKRGIANSLKDAPSSLRDHFLLNFKDEDWKAISPPSNNANAPAVVIVNDAGSIAYKQREDYSTAALAKVLSELRKLPIRLPSSTAE